MQFLGFSVFYGKRFSELESVVCKSFSDLITHLVVFDPDCRANCRHQIHGSRSKDAFHFLHRLFHNPFRGASPAGVDCRDRLVFRVKKQNRHAICGGYAEKDIGFLRDGGVVAVELVGKFGFARLQDAAVDKNDVVAMDF